MGRPRKLTSTMPMQLENLVTVAYVEDMELAQRYRDMLLENAIPAVIRKTESMEKTKFSDIALQVPEEFLDAAYNLLTQQAVCDDFFAAVFGSESNRMSGDMDDVDEDEQIQETK